MRSLLTVTGGEALYADMEHFGPCSNPFGMVCYWFYLVYCLTMQGKAHYYYVTQMPLKIILFIGTRMGVVPNDFLATMAAVIASQAVISGVFPWHAKPFNWAIYLRLSIKHTSIEQGQIYVPLLNWILLAAIIVLVLIFNQFAFILCLWFGRDYDHALRYLY